MIPISNENLLTGSMFSKIKEDTRKFIGRGRFGVVYSAETSDEHVPLVAIKVRRGVC